MIGWREAHRRVERPTPTPPRLKLHVYWHRVALGWIWRVAESDAHQPFALGVADTQPEALAVGLAALEAASVVHA